MLLVSLASANAKCDWSKVTLTQQNNRNNYRFYLDGVNLDDTCIGYVYIVYTIKTGQIDTMTSKNGITDITFNGKGKYNVYLKIWDRCKKCDTSLVREVNIAYFNQCKYSYKLSSTTNTCNDSITAEMSLGTTVKNDTCWQYWHYVYHGPMLDSLTQGQWDTMSDYELFANYDFNDSDLVVIQGPENRARILKYKFPTEGHYLVIPQWYNSCTGQDTFMFRRITIETCNNTGIPSIGKNSIAVSPNPSNDRVLVCLTTPTKNPICAYVLYDASGKVVMSGSISNCTQLNVSNLTNGIYTFKTGNLTQKIVISH